MALSREKVNSKKKKSQKMHKTTFAPKGAVYIQILWRKKRPSHSINKPWTASSNIPANGGAHWLHTKPPSSAWIKQATRSGCLLLGTCWQKRCQLYLCIFRFLSPRTPMFNKIKVVFSHHFIQIIGGCKSHFGQCNMIVVIEIILKTMISDSCSIQRQNI